MLCGVPQPKEMIGRLYALLKPGGRMVAYEHVRAVDGISRRIQGKSPLLLSFLLACSVDDHLTEKGGDSIYTYFPKLVFCT